MSDTYSSYPEIDWWDWEPSPRDKEVEEYVEKSMKQALENMEGTIWTITSLNSMTENSCSPSYPP